MYKSQTNKHQQENNNKSQQQQQTLMAEGSDTSVGKLSKTSSLQKQMRDANQQKSIPHMVGRSSQCPLRGPEFGISQ